MTSPQVAAALMESLYQWDISDLLPEIHAPTLVIQRRGDKAFGPRHAQMLAAGIPGARLVLLDGNQHVWWDGDVDSVAREILGFLDEGVAHAVNIEATSATVRTILFTDLEGHTEMMARLGDAKGRDVLREHEQLTRECLRVHGGAETKSMGDGFMASFGSAQQAVACAQAIQNAFAEPVAGEPLRVRIGVNAGEPVAEHDDLFGASVIIAARIAARAQGAQILVADVVRQLVAGKGFLFSDTGEHVLKGFEEPVRVWELRWSEP